MTCLPPPSHLYFSAIRIRTLNSHNNGLEQETDIRIQVGAGLSLPLPFVLFQHLEYVKKFTLDSLHSVRGDGTLQQASVGNEQLEIKPERYGINFSLMYYCLFLAHYF
jgi:hypothetical protein